MHRPENLPKSSIRLITWGREFFGSVMNSRGSSAYNATLSVTVPTVIPANRGSPQRAIALKFLSPVRIAMFPCTGQRMVNEHH